MLSPRCFSFVVHTWFRKTRRIRRNAGATAHRCVAASLRRCVAASLRRCVVASLRRCVVASLRRCVVASLRRCVVASVRRCFVVSLRRCVAARTSSGHRLFSRRPSSVRDREGADTSGAALRKVA